MSIIILFNNPWTISFLLFVIVFLINRNKKETNVFFFSSHWWNHHLIVIVVETWWIENPYVINDRKKVVLINWFCKDLGSKKNSAHDHTSNKWDWRLEIIVLSSSIGGIRTEYIQIQKKGRREKTIMRERKRKKRERRYICLLFSRCFSLSARSRSLLIVADEETTSAVEKKNRNDNKSINFFFCFPVYILPLSFFFFSHSWIIKAIIIIIDYISFLQTINNDESFIAVNNNLCSSSRSTFR